MAVRINILTTYNGAGNKKALRDLGLMQKQATLAGNGMTASMLGASIGMQRAGASMAKTGTTLSKNVTLPVVALGALAVNVAAKFETSMNQVQAASGASAKEMKSLSAYALKMGADTMFSAGEAAKAMLELSKGGMSAAAIKAGGLKASLDLAAAGNMELAAAAETTIQAMGMFGLKAKAAGSVAAALAGGANASTASVESLALALSQVGPGAGNAGMSLQQTVGVLAAFADKGIRGSDAGTSLKTMLTRLVPTTDKAAKAMKRYGLSFVDGKGNIDSITTVAQKLKTHLGGLSQAQRIAAMATIFGSDATRAATVLMNEGASGVNKYIKAASDKTAAEKMAEARTKGFAGTLESLKGSVETIAIVFGTVLIPVLSNLAKYLTTLANKIMKLSDTQKKWIVTVLSIAAALGPVLVIVGKLTSGIGRVVGVVGKLTLAFGKGGAAAPKWARGIAAVTKGLASFVKQAALALVSLARQAAAWAVHAAKQATYTAMGIALMVKDAAAKAAATAATVANTVATVAASVATKAVAAATKVAAAGQWLLNAAMRANPIGLIIAAVTLLAAGIVLLWKKNETFRRIVTAVWEKIKSVVSALLPVLKAVATAIFGALSATWKKVWAAVKWFWGWAGPYIKAGIALWWRSIKMNMALIRAVFARVWPVIVAIVKGAIQNIKTIVHTIQALIAFVRGVFNAIRSVATTIGHSIATRVGGIWRGIKKTAQTVWNGVTGVVKTAWNNISSFVNKIIGAINWVIEKVPGMGHVGTIPKVPSFASSSTKGNGGAGEEAPRGGHVSTPRIMDNEGMGGPLDSIGSALGSAGSWVGDMMSRLHIPWPKPTGGLFGGATDALLNLVKDAVWNLIKKFGGGDGMQIIDYAKSMLGTPYLWGGTSPGGFDCSGLIYWAYMQAGKSIPRVPTNGGRQISRSQIRPADVMFYYPGSMQHGQRVPFGHFKMYAGNNQTIESTTGGVQMRPADWAGAAQIRTYLRLGGAAFGPLSGYLAMLHGRETVVAHDNPTRGLEDLARSGVTDHSRAGDVYIAPGAVQISFADGGSAGPSQQVIEATVDRAFRRLAAELSRR